MFDDITLGSEILANPGTMVYKILDEISNRQNGIYDIADPNNAFCNLLEAGSSMCSQSVNLFKSANNVYYAQRATTMKELLYHVSNFDFVKITAGPANTTVRVTLDANYLISNAIKYNSQYNRVVIPRGTIFTIGNLTFGIYYPINIDINSVTNTFNIYWDTSVINPLYTLSSNVLTTIGPYSFSLLSLISIDIPVFQFDVSVSQKTITDTEGFNMSIPYTDQFYAARIYTNTGTNNAWEEIEYTLTKDVYDVTVPTAKLDIYSDISSYVVTIPSVYFSSGLMGNKILIETYTTQGSLDYVITSVESSTGNIDLNLDFYDVTSYSSILKNLSTLSLTPLDTVITGGSSALTFDQLKAAINADALDDSVPVTEEELETFFAKNGFTLTRYVDNITSRILNGSATISGGANSYVPLVNGNIQIDTTNTSDIKSILNFNSNTITILPTMYYTYSKISMVATPLTDTYVSGLDKLSKTDLATLLNNETILKCPFHIVTYLSEDYPVSVSYDLTSPKCNNINFIAENSNVSAQISIVDVIVNHLDNGTGGFNITLGCIPTSDMTAIDQSNVVVLLKTVASDSSSMYAYATYGGIQTATNGSSMYVYEVSIPTTYLIKNDDTFETTLYQTQTDTTDCYIDLETTFEVYFLVAPGVITGAAIDSTITGSLISPYTKYIGISKQSIDIIFGTNLSNTIFNITDASYSSQTYKKYISTVYHTYQNDVYATDSTGVPTYTINNGVPELTIIHNSGDFVLDATGNKIIEHNINDLVLDEFGNPIVMADRTLVYYITSMLFDIRLFYSDNTTDISFVSNLSSVVNSYLTTITTMQNSLLERTELYFVPNNSIGNITLYIGNGKTTTVDIGLIFDMTLYVTMSVIDSESSQNVIKNKVIDIINVVLTEETISMTYIESLIENAFPDQITSADVNGINGDTSLQTLFNQNTNMIPVIPLQLVCDPIANTLSLEPNINITFKLSN